MKLKTGRSQSDKDILKDLGDFIEGHFKKVGRIFKKDEKFLDDDFLSYFRAFLDDKGVASVVPSSQFLVKRVIRAMDLRRVDLVVEYGAADGVMTRIILEKMPATARLVSVELNSKLFASLKNISDPRLTVVQGDVRQIDKILAAAPGTVDVIVSGIPFAFLRGRERHELMLKTSELLKHGGRFVAYQVTTHLIGMLEDYFSKVKTQFEIRNLPPHFVFTSYK